MLSNFRVGESTPPLGTGVVVAKMSLAPVAFMSATSWRRLSAYCSRVARCVVSEENLAS
ncbi:hypothetical protein D3C83_164830 [compost metagenome]